MYGIIYGLHCPTSGELRYVGQTTKPLYVRVGNHLSPSGLKKHLYVASWLKGLVNRGLRPVAKVLAEAESREELDRLEVEHIIAAKDAGARLTNLASGGRVNAGFKKSKAACEKIAAARRGTRLRQDTREKIRAAMKARRLTDVHKNRIGDANRGRRASDETREKQSQAKRDPSVSDAQIVVRRARGQTYEEIGRALGVSPSCVQKRLKRFYGQ